MIFVYSNVRETSPDIKETIVFLLLDIISTEISIKEDVENFEMEILNDVLVIRTGI